jgi:hypothetical protein
MPNKTAKKKAAKKATANSRTTSTETEEVPVDESVKLHADIYLQVGDRSEEYVAQFYLHKGAHPDMVGDLEKVISKAIDDQITGPARMLIRQVRIARRPDDPGSAGFLEAELVEGNSSDSPMDDL